MPLIDDVGMSKVIDFFYEYNLKLIKTTNILSNVIFIVLMNKIF